MKTIVDRTSFGSITINGKEYHHYVIIRLSGKVEKRRKKFSKQVYGTSHKISLEEAEEFMKTGVKRLLSEPGSTEC